MFYEGTKCLGNVSQDASRYRPLSAPFAIPQIPFSLVDVDKHLFIAGAASFFFFFFSSSAIQIIKTKLQRRPKIDDFLGEHNHARVRVAIPFVHAYRVPCFCQDPVACAQHLFWMEIKQKKKRLSSIPRSSSSSFHRVNFHEMQVQNCHHNNGSADSCIK